MISESLGNINELAIKCQAIEDRNNELEKEILELQGEKNKYSETNKMLQESNIELWNVLEQVLINLFYLLQGKTKKYTIGKFK